jgi:hypothetical protein
METGNYPPPANNLDPNWSPIIRLARFFYISNCALLIIAVVIYFFNVRITVPLDIYLTDELAFLLIYAAILLVLFLLSLIPGTSGFLTGLYAARALLWYDVALLVLSAGFVIALWRMKISSFPLWLISSLVLANSILGLVAYYIQRNLRYNPQALTEETPLDSPSEVEADGSGQDSQPAADSNGNPPQEVESGNGEAQTVDETSA